MARITARDVARAAGVSQATVSFVLNDRADQAISEPTRRAVLDAVRTLGYVPSGAARSLRRGRSSVVLCVLPDFPVAQALEEFKLTLSRILGASGLACVYLHHENGLPLAEMWPHVHPAVVLSFGPLDDPEAELIRKAGIALIDDLFGAAGAELLGLDQADVGRMQVRHLAARGHTRIGFAAVEDPREQSFRGPRGRGAAEACRQLGMPPPVVLPVDYTVESGAAAVRGWVGAPEPVTAVAAFNDLAAMAVLAGARQEGVDVPAGLAVVGVDDLPAAVLTSPRLSTIVIDGVVPATALAARVLAEAGMPAPLPEPTGPALHLIVRETT